MADLEGQQSCTANEGQLRAAGLSVAVGTSWPAPGPRSTRRRGLKQNPFALPGSRSSCMSRTVAAKLCYRLAANAAPRTTVMGIGTDGMPLATTSSLLSPISRSVGTSKKVETMAAPVATPIELKSCVVA